MYQHIWENIYFDLYCTYIYTSIFMLFFKIQSKSILYYVKHIIRNTHVSLYPSHVILDHSNNLIYTHIYIYCLLRELHKELYTTYYATHTTTHCVCGNCENTYISKSMSMSILFVVPGNFCGCSYLYNSKEMRQEIARRGIMPR